MNFGNILIEKKNGMAKIIINKPPFNILTTADTLDMSKALRQVESDDEVKVVVITGAGNKAFSAGVEFKDHLGDRGPKFLEAYKRLITSLLEIDRVTIAVVNGVALAMPCEIIALCDMAIASEKAQMGLPQMKLGSFPPLASIVFPGLVGNKKTFEIILSGDNFDGKEAERIGFVNKAVPEDELEKETDAFVNRFLEHNGSALRQARQVIYRNLDMAFDKAIKIVWADLEKSLTSDIVIEGFTAAMEKRKPAWKK